MTSAFNTSNFVCCFGKIQLQNQRRVNQVCAGRLIPVLYIVIPLSRIRVVMNSTERTWHSRAYFYTDVGRGA